MQARTLLLIVLIAALGYFGYDRYRTNEARGPEFEESPDQLTDLSLSEVKRRYEAQGYRLKCYGDLQRNERISDDDYLCLAPIRSAFDDVPASLVVFFFKEERLRHVRFEFPASSFTPLQDYMSQKLQNATQLDGNRLYHFGLDPSGNNLVVWATQHGLLTTTATNLSNESVILLWSGKDNFPVTSDWPES
ncbi:hypothetical protein [Pseudomonas sp. SCB32]|uniref:hypothetical protein n=1 Tax=Pseudomonas sp. SCB32 TaxID=2653853 RepID=UPI0012641954|nr:hypothetical protein [Pseudomonas sp. SCB32]